ncbi:MAG: Holliday junction branch migration protein RuvA [Acidobacteriota bacterium]|nr:Holliday junction branch migration protein RuvA [Acidobacteriota bacterium]MDH3522293.1 Holliday junction branch migration protein RuvA [Acidobacteriota bacterium]
MIGYLRGRLLRSTPTALVLDVGGVGYRLQVPMSTFFEIERSAEDEIELWVHTNVREDAIELYGFWTRREKELFEKLIAVSGIGPKLARVILSGMAPDELVAALSRGDIARLSAIPGIGKKTAERMVLELRDRVQALAAELPDRPPTATDDEDLVAALVHLGYRENAARRAVAETREASPEAAFHDRLRQALKRLSRT